MFGCRYMPAKPETQQHQENDIGDCTSNTQITGLHTCRQHPAGTCNTEITPLMTATRLNVNKQKISALGQNAPK